MKFEMSQRLCKEAHTLIPGGAHTYAKCDDQYPDGLAPVIVRGKGCHVWDVDGNEFIEYGMGLRSVTLGHAYDPIVRAASRQLKKGTNYVRPASIEVECAKEFLGIMTGSEMVKFAKNGSDVTNGAVKLSRAYTGRDYVAICAEHPFFSVDDWFIGSTPMAAGVPKVIRDLTIKFHYNDIESVRALFKQFPNKIACVILEAEKETPPLPGFLQALQRMCRANGTVFVLDEMITGFRWHLSGAQRYFEIEPDLSCFGKAMANGFSVAALSGRRDIMNLGGIDHGQERVFLLSNTHGAETHGLAAALETMRVYQREPVIDYLWDIGERLRKGVKQAIADHKLEGYFEVSGRPCCMVYSTKDENKERSQPYRTLFLQETVKRGLLLPSLIVSYSHTRRDIKRTVEIIHEALAVYRKALDEGIKTYILGRPVRPLFRTFN